MTEPTQKSLEEAENLCRARNVWKPGFAGEIALALDAARQEGWDQAKTYLEEEGIGDLPPSRPQP